MFGHPKVAGPLAIAFSVFTVLALGVAPAVATVGDGGTEGAVGGVQAATSSSTAISVSGCTVIDQAGLYELTRDITAPADETCIFINSSDVVFDGNGYLIKGNGTGANHGHPIAVEDSSHISEGSAGPLDNVTVRNVEVASWSQPVFFSEVDNATVENVVIRDTFHISGTSSGTGLAFFRESNIRVVDSRIVDVVGRGIDITNAQDSRIARTTVNNSGGQAILIDRNSGHVVRNNTVLNSFKGIYTEGFIDGILIEDNTVRSTTRNGMRIRATRNASIRRNTVTGNDDWGIWISGTYSENNTVRNNTAGANGLGGIKVVESERSLVQGNHVTENNDGISIRSANNNSVRNNTVLNNDADGLTVSSAENLTVAHNILSNHTGSDSYGIRVKNGHEGLRVLENTVCSNTRGLLFSRYSSGAATIERNRIASNVKDGIFIDISTPVEKIDIHANVIANNGNYGIYSVNDEGVVRATDNWWGSADGPSSPGSTALEDPFTAALANGSGDAVSENGSEAGVSNVHFDPWLTSEPSVAADCPSSEDDSPTPSTTSLSDCAVIDSAGRYELDTDLHLPANQTCLFINASDVIFDGNGHSITAFPAGKSDGYPIGAKDSTGMDEFTSSYLSNVTVRNVTVGNWSKSVRFYKVDNATVEHVLVRDTRQRNTYSTPDGLSFRRGTDISVADSRFADIASVGLYLNRPRQVTITGTTIDTTKYEGMLVKGDYGVRENHTIRRNTVANASGGIGTTSSGAADGMVVANNSLRNANIRILGGSHNRISHNTVTEAGGNAIKVQGGRSTDNNTVADNVIRQNGRNGILVHGSPQSLIANNTVWRNGYNGIRLEDSSSNTSIRDNNVTSNLGDGMQVFSSRDVTVADNVLVNHTGPDSNIRGLFLTGGTSSDGFLATGNVICGNGQGVRLGQPLGSATLDDNRIAANELSGIKIDFGVPVAKVAVHHNVISNYGDFGITSQNDSGVVNATDNWWGSTDGPSSPDSTTLEDPFTATLADGSGDAVSENGSKAGVSNVHFDPWLTSEPSVAAECPLANSPPSVSADDDTVTVDEGGTATNNGSYFDADGDNVTLTVSVGTITKHADGTWNWSYTVGDGPDDSQTVTVTAEDDDGATNQTTFELNVTNVPPTVSADNATVTVDEGENASNTGTWADPGNDTVSLSASVGTVTKNADGTWTWYFNTSDGPDESQTVTITAEDDDGAQHQTTFELVVDNLPPSVSADEGSLTVNETETATNNGTFGDPVGDNVTLTASVGSLTQHPNGTWSWSFDTDDGPDQSQTVTINATDEDGASNETSFSLTVENLPPSVTADQATVTVGEGDTASNTGTYADPGNDTVTLTASVGTITKHADGTWSWSFDTSDGPDQSQTVTINATDDDGDATTTTFDLNVTNVPPSVAADNGSVTVGEGETATNTGTWGDAGNDTVTLTASIGTVTTHAGGTWEWTYVTGDGPSSQTVTVTATDDDGASNQTTFDLHVTNAAPSVNADNESVTVDEGETATNTGTYLDPGGDSVTLTASVGTVAKTGTGTWDWSFDTSDGPDESQTVTITAEDEDGAANSTTFDLTVANTPPTVSADHDTVTVEEGQTATNTGTYGDAGDDNVTLSASVGTVTKQADGTWDWSFATSDGPDDSQTVTITAEDEDGATSQTTFELNVTNAPPTVAADHDSVTVTEGETATNTGTWSDPGDDTVSLSASVGSVTKQADGTWDWSYDTTGVSGSLTVTVTAEDDDGATDTASFNLTVEQEQTLQPGEDFDTDFKGCSEVWLVFQDEDQLPVAATILVYNAETAAEETVDVLIESDDVERVRGQYDGRPVYKFNVHDYFGREDDTDDKVLAVSAGGSQLVENPNRCADGSKGEDSGEGNGGDSGQGNGEGNGRANG